MTMKIILASGSPRRRELLKEIGLTFEIYKPNVDEARLPGEAPENLCLRLSRLKALAGVKAFAGESPVPFVIAADTMVVINGDILGKPHDHDEAFSMLNELQGREHEVITGMTVAHEEKIISHAEHSFVNFKPMTSEEICDYISTGECDDKAGAYAIQGKGSLFIERIRGDYSNVVGLPLFALGKIFREDFGENLMRFVG